MENKEEIKLDAEDKAILAVMGLVTLLLISMVGSCTYLRHAEIQVKNACVENAHPKTKDGA